jgi:hypothetical protein
LFICTVLPRVSPHSVISVQRNLVINLKIRSRIWNLVSWSMLSSQMVETSNPSKNDN